jgi:hypothetical protein
MEDRIWINVREVQTMRVQSRVNSSVLILTLNNNKDIRLTFKDKDKASLEAHSVAILNEDLVPFDAESI